MPDRLLADLVVVLHALFLLFVVGGALLVRRAPRLALAHLLCVAWGVWVELVPGAACPLTDLENLFARRAGEAGYASSFVEHYLVPVIYPEGLTRGLQWALALLVVATNGTLYGLWWARARRARQDG